MPATSRAAAWALLLQWDAPFLPVPGEEGAGEGLARLRKASLGVRAAAALQLLAAAEFLFAQGWYPERRLLRGARVARGESGVIVRLADLPRWRLDDRRFRGASGQRVLAVDALAIRLVWPLLVLLVPERRAAFAAALARSLPGEAATALVEVLNSCGRREACLDHRDGRGRALWVRRLELPQEGIVWVEEEDLLPRLRAAALLARTANIVEGGVVAGRLDEGEVIQEQTRHASAGVPLLVLTTLPVAGSSPLRIAPEEGAIWVLPLAGSRVAAHVAAAREWSGGRAREVAELLAAGARRAFVSPPTADRQAESRTGLASAAARRALARLAASPIGLDGSECRAVGISEEVCAELLRLGLVRRHGERWRAVALPTGTPTREEVVELAAALPLESLAGMAARALAVGQWQPLQRWCRERLDSPDGAGEVLALAAALPPVAALALLAAEAALTLGRLREAEGFLSNVPVAERDGAWHVLEGWRALLAGTPQRAAEALSGAEGESEPRWAARRALLLAELAHQRGDGVQERAHLETAMAFGGRLAAEAALYRAALEGGAALLRLRREAWRSWSPELRVRYLHLVGLERFRRDAFCAAPRALRAALRLTSGQNPLVLGELCADLATCHVMLDRPAAAERFYGLAESYLERAGTQRALYLVRANRAVVANDLMRWRQARELLAGVTPPPGPEAELHRAANATELARAELVRGRLEEVRAVLPRLETTVEANPAWTILARAVGSLRLHLALAEGDLAAARTALTAAEETDRVLGLALLAAQQGEDPAPALPPRWGVAPCASLLAAWRRGEKELAHQRAVRHLARWPREGAVGLARFAHLLSRAGERLDGTWEELLRRAEAVLAEAELDGWADRLRQRERSDPLTVVRALVATLTAGTGCVEPAFLAPLARALGLEWVELRRGERRLGGCGVARAVNGALTEAGVTVRWGGADGELVRAALAGVARLAGTQGEPEGEGTSVDGALVGRSAALQRVRGLIASWGPLPFPVLITGEPGTGKELVARELHRCSGRRGPLVPVNCAAVPAQIIERELFGTVRGAFTGADQDREGLVEAAEGGTLFLDEIGELPLELQAKLLRLLQEREVRRLGSTRVRVVDVRFIAATNRDLEEAVAKGEFRPDLYYRLAAAVIHVPPLRERPEDLEELAVLFCQRAARECQRPGVRLAPAALDALRQGRWPGNARELEWAIRRAVVAAQAGEALGPERFTLTAAVSAEGRVDSFAEAREEFLRKYFRQLLAATGGNRSEAARRAGLTRQGLLYHLRLLGLRNG